MGLAVGLVLVSYYLLKPARDGLFLAAASPERLPWVYMLAAAVAAPVAALHGAVGRRVSVGRMAVGTLLVLAATLPGLRALVLAPKPWVPYLLYAWAGIVGALATSQIWLVAGVAFDAGQAKRIYPQLSVGAIVGAVVGGETARLLIDRFGFGAEDLLGAAAATLVLCAALLGWTLRRWRVTEPDRTGDSRRAPSGEGSARTLKLVARSRHLSLVMGLLAVAVVVTTFVDYQFKTIAWRTHPDAASLAAFLGRFYGLVSLASLLVQTTLSGRLLDRFGVGGLVGVLPVVLAFGSGAVFVAPGLAAASFLRGGDLGLKHSLDRTGRELLLLPLPMELKKRTKLFIDVFVDRWFRGLAGALLLLATAVLGLSVRALAVPVLVLVALWLVLVWRVRGAYAEAFRRALARREIDPDDLRRRIRDEGAVAAVDAALGSSQPRRVLYALSLASSMEGLDHERRLLPLLDHDSAEIRASVLDVMSELRLDGGHDRATALMDDAAPAVRRAACGYLAVRDDRGAVARLRDMLEEGAPRERIAAAAWMADHASRDDVAGLPDDVVGGLLDESGPDAGEARLAAVALMGRIGGRWTETLVDLLDHDDPAVARSAVRSLAAHDGPGRDAAASCLSDRRLRAAAREALVAVGPSALPTLVAAAATGEPLARVQALRALGALGGSDAAEHLLDHAADPEPLVRDAALMALVRMRVADKGIKPSLDRLADLHNRRLAVYHGLFQARRLLAADDGPAAALLARTLDESTARAWRDLFIIAALRHRPRDSRDAWLALQGGDRHQRAGAAEFLGQALREPFRSRMAPLVGDALESDIVAAGRRAGIDLADEREALAFLLELDEPWLRACAAYRAGTGDDTGLRDLAAGMADDASPLVREAASLAKAG